MNEHYYFGSLNWRDLIPLFWKAMKSLTYKAYMKSDKTEPIFLIAIINPFIATSSEGCSKETLKLARFYCYCSTTSHWELEFEAKFITGLVVWW